MIYPKARQDLITVNHVKNWLGLQKPIGLILHWTGEGEDPQGARNWFNTPNEKRPPDRRNSSSAHFLIGRDGKVLQCADTSWRVNSVDGNVIDGNRLSVEVCATPADPEFRAAQMKACAELLFWMNEQWDTPLVETKTRDVNAGGLTYHKLYGSTECPGPWAMDNKWRIVTAAIRLKTGGGVIPMWLPGWWQVTWRNQSYFYFFENNHRVKWSQTPPLSKALPMASPTDSGSFTCEDGGVIRVQWDSSGSVEKYRRDFSRFSMDEATMIGTWNDGEEIIAKTVVAI